MSWDDLKKEVESGVVAGVPDFTGPVLIDKVRVHKKFEKRLLFVDLLIESGPLAGKIAQVKLYIPEAGNRNAGFYFLKKVAGLDMSAAFDAAKAADPDGSNIEGALNAIADNIVGQRAIAEITLVQDGDYAGTNELQSTKPLDGSAVAAATPVASVVGAAPQAVPAPAEPSVAGSTPTPDAVAVAAAAVDDGVEF